MATGTLAYHMLARHGQAIDRLKRDMAAEQHQDNLVNFLAYDTANFVYAFLLASGNNVTPTDRKLRDELQQAIEETLARHGIVEETFVLEPQL